MADLNPESMQYAWVVIGCGNPARADDGAGIEVIQRLARTNLASRPDLRLIDAGTSGMDILYQTRGAQRVIIVDASHSGSEPGAVFHAPAIELSTPIQPAFTLHALRWDHALYAASQIHGRDFLRNIEVFLIEAESLDFSFELSPAAERGVTRVVAEIQQLLNPVEIRPT